MKTTASASFRPLQHVIMVTVVFTLIYGARGVVAGSHTEETPPVDTPVEHVALPTRPLGATGFDVTILGLGGQATIERHGNDTKAYEIITRALDLGVNYIDTAPIYGNGISETYIGRVMKDRRDDVFLATKSHDYSYEGTMRLVKDSLERLQTDHIDLYQHHNVSSDSQLDRILAEDGALRAFRELKEKGVISHIGITSHSPRILLRALEHDDYECMLITLNPAGAIMPDREYLMPFLRKAQEKNVGVIAMKLASRGTLVSEDAPMKELLRYAWSFPISTAIVGISETWQIEENAASAHDATPMTEEEKKALEAHFTR